MNASTATLTLMLAVFGASLVEGVEALTLVTAAGTRSWRSALEGTAAAFVVLTIVTLTVGIPLTHFVPITALRIVVGGFALYIGVTWLRKAILRSAGLKALHDEDRIYEETVASMDGTPIHRRDKIAFLVAFKGVMLEGFEVVFIVIALGANTHRLGLAAGVAGATWLLLAVVGAIVARRMSNVPENTLKTVVAVILTSVGLFWVGEGLGIHWPGSDAIILAFIATAALVNRAVVARLRRKVPVTVNA